MLITLALYALLALLVLAGLGYALLPAMAFTGLRAHSSAKVDSAEAARIERLLAQP